MDQRVKANVELYKKNGQWRMTLFAPDWVLSDLIHTMEQQTHPQVLVYASASYSCDLGSWEYIHFTTWGGGSIGSEATHEKKQIILKEITND